MTKRPTASMHPPFKSRALKVQIHRSIQCNFTAFILQNSVQKLQCAFKKSELNKIFTQNNRTVIKHIETRAARDFTTGCDALIECEATAEHAQNLIKSLRHSSGVVRVTVIDGTTPEATSNGDKLLSRNAVKLNLVYVMSTQCADVELLLHDVIT